MHGRCLFLEILSRHEGPRTAFEILLERFPEAPGLVIYDNACNLQRYIEAREPHFFRNTLFRIDGFHSPGHVKCPRECSCSSYKRAGRTFEFLPGVTADLNTQVAEQANSRIEIVRKTCASMTQRNFFSYVTYFFQRTNAEF